MRLALVFINSEVPTFLVRTRKELDNIVKTRYPAFQRMPKKEHPSERYYECETGYIHADFQPSAMLEVKP